MAATSAQTALARAFDRDLYGQIAELGIWDSLVDQATSELNLAGLATGKRDPAVVRLAFHLGLMQNPTLSMGGAETGSAHGGSSRSSSQSHLPEGYPADWYQTGHGRALIGLFSSSSACAPIG